jgi:hypothetical protein
MKDPPAIVDRRWLGGDFLRRPCFGATPRQAGWVDQPWAFIFVDLTTFPLRRKWPTRLPAFHSQNAPAAFLPRAQIVIQTPATAEFRHRRRLTARPAAYPEDPAARRLGPIRVAENTPGKLNCSAMNLFPNRTH